MAPPQTSVQALSARLEKRVSTVDVIRKIALSAPRGCAIRMAPV
jgi:hypothetical protein